MKSIVLLFIAFERRSLGGGGNNESLKTRFEIILETRGFFFFVQISLTTGRHVAITTVTDTINL